MTSPARTWIWFALVCAVILAAAGWMGATVWEQDAREQRAGAQALWEQKVQAALWRMDAAASAIVAREAARRPEEIAELAGDAAAKADAAPAAESKKTTLRYFNRAESKTAKAEGLAAGAPKKDARVAESAPQAAAAKAQAPDALASRFKLPAKGGGLLGNPSAEDQIQTQQDNSYVQRSLANLAFNSNYAGPLPGKNASTPAAPPAQALAASAENDDIVLSRRIETPRRDLVQGVRLDAQAVAAELLPLARVDFPKAQLRPEPDPQAHSARTLAAMPLRFFPGEEPVVAVGWSPVRSAVFGAGSALLVALGAVALLLARTLALSQRRAEFVSTMTHELRTPLTTFRLYTDLLEAAPETADRARYTHVLAREAERLSHLVENVLAYARLEHGRKNPQTQTMTVDDLLANMLDRLQERATRAGFALEVVPHDGAAGVKANPATVEQILLNLVDNAGKYAHGATDKRLILGVEKAQGLRSRAPSASSGAKRHPHPLQQTEACVPPELALGARERKLVISLRDFGPGLDPAVKKRLFTPFSRSDKDAAGNAPGVGLGLALSRRLARDMGGDLRHEEADPGARFTLVLAG